MAVVEEAVPVEKEDGKTTKGDAMLSVATLAANGKTVGPRLRMDTVFGPRGVSITALKGRWFPSSLYTRILTGV